MEGLTAREWYLFGLQIIAPLLFALTIWLGRTSFMRTSMRYPFVLLILSMVLIDAYEGFTATHTPLALRVMRLLSLAVLAITALLAWPRKKT